jgi:hypothetical protein
MTSTVTSLTTQALSSHTYDYLTTTVGLAVIGALAVLLLVRELALIFRGGSVSREMRALDLALMPLLIVFTIIVIARFMELLK